MIVISAIYSIISLEINKIYKTIGDQTIVNALKLHKNHREFTHIGS